MERTAGENAEERMAFVRGVARRDFAVVRDGRAMAAMERWVATVMRASKDKVE